MNKMEGICRGCLIQSSSPADLLQYTEKNRRLFVYSTGIQVKRNDTFTFQLCEECYMYMKQSCKFKKQCRNSEKKFRSYLLKQEDGGDFASWLKSTDENVQFRLPFSSGYSTPAHQIAKDDDNESTCTSIRNFMTDILDGEEMPPTEARIIRELIQEEADILDDSLDSQWLDDVTVGSDFDEDFGISPFGTPRSVRNNAYTPQRIDEAKQRQINYLTSKEIIEKINKPRISQKYDMPLLENMDIEEEIDFKKKDTKSNSPELHEFDNSIPSEVEDMVTENSISSTLQCFKTDILKNLAVEKQMDILEPDTKFVDYDETIATSKVHIEKTVIDSPSIDDMCVIISQGKAGTKDEAPTNDLEYYVNKAELKKQITSLKNKKEYHCTIDRNIDIALKNDGKKEYSLDHLIVSPAASSTGITTPTIQSILFGSQDISKNQPKTSTPLNMLEQNRNTNTVPKYFPQVGQNIDFDDDKKEFKTENDLDYDYRTDDFDTMDNVKLEDMKDHNIPDQVNEITQKEHNEILNQFLQDTNSPVQLCGEIIDPHEFSEQLLDQGIFKRPQTPPAIEYDLEKSYCKKCDRTFATPRALKQHFAKMHNFVFPKLDKHRNNWQKTLVKVCYVCSAEIRGASNFTRHLKIHDKSSEFFECDVCKMFFKSKMALKVHMRTHNNMGPVTQKKNYLCNICGRNSRTLSHHKLHMRRHLKQVSVTCSICQKGFYRNNDLQTHIRIQHQGERPYECQYCPKSFKRRFLLHAHMKRHLGKFDHKCEICNLEFVSREILAVHYGSKKCIEKRERLSLLKSSEEQVTVQYSTGSLEKIKKNVLCTEKNKVTENSEEILDKLTDDENDEDLVENI